jgi:hypothetical protein
MARGTDIVMITTKVRSIRFVKGSTKPNAASHGCRAETERLAYYNLSHAPGRSCYVSQQSFLLPSHISILHLRLIKYRDMANIPVEWEVEGILTPQESVEGMLRVIPMKGLDDSGTFWTWEGNVHPW